MTTMNIHSFITLIDQTFFGTTKSNELLALWKQVTHFETCKSSVRSGKREGEPCGKPCVKGQVHCICHKSRPVNAIEIREKCSDTFSNGKKCTRFCVDDKKVCALHDKPKMEKCSYTLISGQRRGQMCAKKCMVGTNVCIAHAKKKDEAKEDVQNEDVQKEDVQKDEAKEDVQKDDAKEDVQKDEAKEDVQKDEAKEDVLKDEDVKTAKTKTAKTKTEQHQSQIGTTSVSNRNNISLKSKHK